MPASKVMDPEGSQWVVRRKWAHRRLRWRGKPGVSELIDGADVAALGGDLPVVGVILMVVALLLFAVAAVMFVVPAVIFVVELLLVAAIVGGGVAGRVLFGRPWTVEARQVGATEAFEWKVEGWRASRELRDTIADQLRATGVPSGGSRVALPDE